MITRTKEWFEIACDRCGEILAVDETTEAGAINVALAAGWIVSLVGETCVRCQS
jgi:hypothetical protein